MTKEDFFKLLERYEKGLASQEDRNLFDQFFASLNSRKSEWDDWDMSTREKVRLAVYYKMRANISVENKQKSWVWKVAASVIILIGLGLSVYLYDAPANEAKYLTKSTSRGQRATITLADGTIVSLNSESSITFPESFNQFDTREVKLTGEAFFEVVKDESKPFIIESGDLTTKVLGTTFNIKAYPDDLSIAVTVTSGIVQVEPNKINQKETKDTQSDPVILIKGQQASYDKALYNINKNEVSLQDYLGWRDNVLIFKDTPLKEAIIMMERWFNVEIELAGSQLEECHINGTFKGERLINILESMKFVNRINYEVKEDSKILITGSKCKN